MVDILQVVVRCLLAVASSRGGIAEVEKRKPVAWILYLHFFLVVCEFVAYSLVIYFEASSQKCLSKACFFLRNSCLLGLVLLVVSLIFILTTFDSTGRVWRHHPGLWCMEEGASSRRLNRAQAHRLIARLWRRRIRCLACLRNACRRLDLDTKRSSRDAMLLVSDMVGTRIWLPPTFLRDCYFCDGNHVSGLAVKVGFHYSASLKTRIYMIR
ncbi:unnamed protein product [Hydatigera taeniaeformis]|uniref:Uncharacterized protein n=1 Tax=Hydatigena taeniaeformis TaxID=6205 RepID=A0A3P7FJP5_HYDTA|nr:unnamed protein product [Hydatigera taeniaeformis]